MTYKADTIKFQQDFNKLNPMHKLVIANMIYVMLNKKKTMQDFADWEHYFSLLRTECKNYLEASL